MKRMERVSAKNTASPKSLIILDRPLEALRGTYLLQDTCTILFAEKCLKGYRQVSPSKGANASRHGIEKEVLLPLVVAFHLDHEMSLGSRHQINCTVFLITLGLCGGKEVKGD